MPAIRVRARSTSASVGPCSVFNSEHLLHDLANGAQGIELAVVFDRAFEMRLRARRRDGEHLTGEVPPPALVEPAVLLEELTVPDDLVPELRYVLVAHRLGQHDRRLPLTLGV